MGSGSCCNGNALQSDELKILLGRTFHFEAQFNRFADALYNLIQRRRLSVTRGKLRYRRNIIAFLVSLNDDIEVT